MVLFETQLSVYVSDVFSKKHPQKRAQGTHRIDRVENSAVLEPCTVTRSYTVM